MLFKYFARPAQTANMGLNKYMTSIGITVDYLPININIRNKATLVLGAGTVATRKIKMLLKAGANITCIGLEFSTEILQLSEQQKLTLIGVDLQAKAKQFITPVFLKQFHLIISATNNDFIAKQVFRIGEANNLLINTVDHRALCNYITPAIIDRSPIVVAVSSAGTAPVLVRNIREKIEKLIPQNLGLLATKANSLRDKVIGTYHSLTDRKHFWEGFFSSSYANDILHRRKIDDDDTIIHNINQQLNHQGEVALVGAGPGDPELLTIKALRLLQEADVVFHDRLVSAEILELVRRDAELVSVGKSQHLHSVPQQQINQLLVDHALAGKKVVRLKGGDPFVFGRGGEELQILKKHGIQYQIVPGITAAIGCSAYAGIPLTHRDHAQSVLFITAHCKDSIDTLDWQSLARENQTIAVYMGLMKSAFLSEQLIAHGKNPETPLAIIVNGTTVHQKVIRSQLNCLAQTIKDQDIKSPAMIIIGDVAALNDDLAWFNTQNSDTKTPVLKTA